MTRKIRAKIHQRGPVPLSLMCAGPEVVGEDAQAEVDAAAAEEQRADEEEARGEDADCGMRAMGEVLVHRAGAGVAAREQCDRVGDGEDAEPGDEHAQGGVEARAGVRVRDQREHQRDREHRPDREGLGHRVDRAEPAFAQLPSGWLHGHFRHRRPPQKTKRMKSWIHSHPVARSSSLAHGSASRDRRRSSRTDAQAGSRPRSGPDRARRGLGGAGGARPPACADARRPSETAARAPRRRA